MTNALALAAQRHLGNTEVRLNASVQHLASGQRITTAAEDPAGLAISDQMNATIRSLGVAQRNTQDGISLIQVFEGGTNEINNMLIRMRELAMQSASDTISDKERTLLNHEVTELKSEITRIARTTTFSGKELLAGADLSLEFQVGANNDPEKDRIKFSPKGADLTSDGLEVSDVDLTKKENAQESLEKMDTAITRVNELRAILGAAQSRLHTTLNAQSIHQENLTDARSRIRDTDLAKETTNLTRETILKQAGIAVLSQANDYPKLALQLLKS